MTPRQNLSVENGESTVGLNIYETASKCTLNVRQHLDTLNTSDKMRTIFQKLPIVAYKRDHHLGDWLVQVTVKQIGELADFYLHNAPRLSKYVCFMLLRGVHRSDPDKINVASYKQECGLQDQLYGL